MLLNSPVKKLAFSAVTAALSLVLLLLGCLLPSGKLALAALAACLGAAVVLSCSRRWALLCWVAVSILSMLLLPQKRVAVLYLLLGHYPVVKSLLEGLRSRVLEWILKIFVFYALLFGLYFGLRELFAELFTPPFGILALFFVAAGAAFVAFDLAFSQLIVLYEQRILKHIKE